MISRWLATVLLTLTQVGWAQTQLSLPEQQANIVTNLFLETCIKTVGIEEKIAAWATEKSIPEFTPNIAKKILNGLNGRVWYATSPQGAFIIQFSPARNCAVIAPAADPKLAAENLRTLMKSLPTSDGTVRTEEDRMTADGVHKMVFSITKSGEPYQWLVISTIKKNEDATAQVRFTFGPEAVAN